MSASSGREHWKIDTERSTLSFTLRHGAHRRISGQFRCWGGQLVVDPRDPRRPSVHIWVELSSLDTGSERRNQAILATELFDVAWEPALVFDSETVEANGPGGLVMKGWLGLHSFRKPIVVSVELGSPDGAGAEAAPLVATARASIDRHAFGLRRESRARDWLSERLVGRIIEMTAHVEAAPAALAAARSTANGDVTARPVIPSTAGPAPAPFW
jgi:polyisoprenoid-binding protein YceI